MCHKHTPTEINVRTDKQKAIKKKYVHTILTEREKMIVDVSGSDAK